MDRTYRFRTGLVVSLILLMAAVFAMRLFGLQLTEDEETAYDNATTTTYEQRIIAARGELLDLHGTVLVSNRATYNVIINSFVLYNSDDPNGSLLALAETCIKNGIEYRDSLPLTMTKPYAYTEDVDDYSYKRFLLKREWDADMTAENLAKKLRSVYHISEDYTETQARLVMGLRYELDLPIYAYTDTYTLAEDVTAEELAIIKELAIPGLDVTAATVREYNTAFAAQLLGTVAAFRGSQYEDTYEALGYAMDAKVGQDGLEAAFEEYLCGTDGTKVVTVAADGTVLDEYWKEEPKSGANVVTTLDIGLQEVAEKALADRIQAVAKEKEEKNLDGADADAGAVVVMDVRNGEVLAAANYPTVDAREMAEKYDELVKLEVSPLRNRALLNAYPPGSTFKPITAVAALRTGVGPGYTVDGEGIYEFSDGTTQRCWVWTQSGGAIVHGTQDMRGAIAQSCNIYFYTVGLMVSRSAGIEKLIETAESFGVGKDPGSEVYSDPGQMATPELKKETYKDTENAENDQGWYDADTTMASIGQSLTEMTPLQMCRYITSVANKGTLYKATFLRRAVDSDFQSLIYENDYTPEAAGLLSDSEWQVLHEGMRQCVEEGTGSGLKDYPVAVCAKTGTASQGTGGSDHGAFVCYAPAEDPQIAIAIYVEHGASGSNFAEVAATIMDYYFGAQDLVQETAVENKMTED